MNKTYDIYDYDRAKTRVLKFIMFQMRTKFEIIKKFEKDIDKSLLDDVISELEDLGYINDKKYVASKFEQSMKLKHVCINEIKVKLQIKGINRDLIEDYIFENEDVLESYEIESAKINISKKKDKDINYIKQYLMKKGYSSSNLNKAISMLEND